MVVVQDMRMNAVMTPVIEQFVEFFEKTATPEEIAAFQVSSDSRQVN